MHLIPLNIIDFLYRYSQRHQLLHSIFFDVVGLAIDFPSNVWPVVFATSWADIYKFPFFARILPYFTLQLWKFGSKTWLGFPFGATASETSLPCWARLGCGWVGGFMPGLLVCAFVYSLISFWSRFFSSLKEFFLIDPNRGMNFINIKKRYYYLFSIII